MTELVTVARVLVAMDFDDASAAALRMAAVLARAWQAEMTVVHAQTDDVPAYFTARQIDEIEGEQQQRRRAIAHELRTFAAPEIATATVRIASGPPQDAILHLAPEFDLIALGTHQRHGPRRWWLGSVAESVVRQSPRPVLVVPARAAVPSGTGLPHILVAGTGIPIVDQWAATLRSAFDGGSIEAAGIDDCTPDRLRAADLIVFPLADDADHAHVKAMAHVLKECLHPVLFVPYSDQSLERSSS